MSERDEAERQRALLAAIHHRAAGDALTGLLADGGARQARGLAAYRAQAQFSAERALSSACPVLQALVGEDSFAGLARAYWRRHPPRQGDWATYGAHLPAFVADSETLAEVPYLADVARLELAVHRAASAVDCGPVDGLERLADTDPTRLVCRLAPGAALIESPHPVGSIWLAHQQVGEARHAALAELNATGAAAGEAVWVWRQGWRVRVAVLTLPDAGFNAALLAGSTLAQALDAARFFSFEQWLTRALREGWLAGIDVIQELT